jgi:multidrug efflux pump
MTLYSLSVRRPVFATVMALFIIIFGGIAFYYLGVREYPAVDPAVISVSTTYSGADADVIDKQITQPIEEQVNRVQGIKTLTGVSRRGRSTVTAEFDLGTDLNRAASDVRAAVSRARRLLPQDVEPPNVSKSSASAPPILFLNIRSEERSLMELTQIADEQFKERVQTIEGVSTVDIWGDKSYSMRMWLEPRKLAAYDLVPADVRQALESANVQVPSGSIESQNIQLTVRTLSRFETEEEFNDLIIKDSGGEVVRFRDVGYAEIGPRNQRTILKRDGTPMVGIVLRPLPGANYISIVDEFYNRLDEIKRELPADVETATGFDTTTQIRQSIAQVRQTLLIALALVVSVIFLFLRDWRSTVIPLMVIPVALIGAFFVMWVAGFSINVLTLLALVLGIGLVVDDAIVVLENIYAKVEDGEDPAEGAVEGTREIYLAVIATTVALVVVFLPIIFLGGLTGQLFRQFGLTLAGAVVISSFSALTLTPMLASKLLKQREQKPWFYRKTEPFFQKMARGYRRTLAAFLKARWLAFVVLLGCVGLSYVLYTSLPRKLAPVEDRSRLRLFVQGRQGATFDYMDDQMDKVTELIDQEIEQANAIISVTSPGFGASTTVNSGFGFAVLEDASEREVSQMQLADTLSQAVSQIQGARVRVSQEQTISVGGGQGPPVQFVLQGPNLEKLKEALPAFIKKARQSETFSFVNPNLKFNQPELRVEIDRDRADVLGVSARDISETLQLALAPQRVGYFVYEGEQREIVTQVEREDRDETLDLQGLHVKSESGEPVLLSNLVDVEGAAAPPVLYRFNRYQSATISAELAPGKTIAQGIAEMRRIADETLDPSLQTALTGPAKDFADSSNRLIYVFGLAVLLIYLVLAAQFESFRDPAVILLTVPLAVVGALGALWVFGWSINIFSQIGIVMLIGLITKNGILIVEFANQRKAQGRSVREAIADAAEVRFRPILMTALSTTLGVLPIALKLGAGSRSRVPMGLAVIGGLLIGTALTLYVIPAMYTYLTSEEASVAATPGDGAVGGNGKAERPKLVAPGTRASGS